MTEDETLKRLIEERRKKLRKYMIILLIVTGIIGIITAFGLMIIGLIIMLLGASSLTSISTQLVKVRYSTYMNPGFHELVEEEKKDRNRYFYQTLFSFILGLSIFLIALYLLSMGWYGII